MHVNVAICKNNENWRQGISFVHRYMLFSFGCHFAFWCFASLSLLLRVCGCGCVLSIQSHLRFVMHVWTTSAHYIMIRLWRHNDINYQSLLILSWHKTNAVVHAAKHEVLPSCGKYCLPQKWTVAMLQVIWRVNLKWFQFSELYLLEYFGWIFLWYVCVLLV